MRTPKHMTKAINNRIITAEILGSCIYSCNKRAKNYRDQARKYHCARFVASNREYMQKYYQMKDEFLSILEPVEIHIERIPRYYEENSECCIQYYLFYRVGGFSFHHPIKKEEIDPGLPVKEIDPLKTSGHNVSDLLPPQFCQKVLALIQSNDYTYDPQNSIAGDK